MVLFCDCMFTKDMPGQYTDPVHIADGEDTAITSTSITSVTKTINNSNDNTNNDTEDNKNGTFGNAKNYIATIK